jgi:hypothetical protein
MCLQFGFVIFWQKEFGAKAAHKMLVKLTLLDNHNSRRYWNLLVSALFFQASGI